MQRRIESDEYLTDEGKRKKEDVEELFKRSKSIHRTPSKGPDCSDSMKNQMKNVMELMKNLSRGVKDIKIEQNNKEKKNTTRRDTKIKIKTKIIERRDKGAERRK